MTRLLKFTSEKLARLQCGRAKGVSRVSDVCLVSFSSTFAGRGAETFVRIYIDFIERDRYPPIYAEMTLRGACWMALEMRSLAMTLSGLSTSENRAVRKQRGKEGGMQKADCANRRRSR